MVLILLYALGVPLLLAAALGFALGPARALPALLAFQRALCVPGPERRAALALLVLGLLNFGQAAIDPWLSRSLGYELTPWVAALEGDFVERLQAQTSSVPAWLWSLLYLPAWPALLLASLVALRAHGGWRAAGPCALAFAANYLCALPAYLLAPVVEPAWSAHSKAAAVLEQFSPGISASLRAGSALDNCLPSLHVSLCVSALLAAQHARCTRLVFLLALFLLATMVAVHALGVHWGLDTLSALPFGAMCAWCGRRWYARDARAHAPSRPPAAERG